MIDAATTTGFRNLVRHEQARAKAARDETERTLSAMDEEDRELYSRLRAKRPTLAHPAPSRRSRLDVCKLLIRGLLGRKEKD